MPTRLILVEGIPGSGKSTTARFIADTLKGRDEPAVLYLEGSLDHPADYESVACLDDLQYQTIQEEFPTWKGWLEEHVMMRGRDIFFRYRKLEQEFEDVIPQSLIRSLALYEIYELPVEKHLRLMRESWNEFTAKAPQQAQKYIFECCFLQNPLTFLLGRNAESSATAQAHIMELAQIVAPLEPVLIYLHPVGTRQALEEVARIRPVDWLESVISYHTGQGSGKAQGWAGFDGLVNFYEMRQQVELDILPHLPWPVHRIQHQGWEQDHQEVVRLLDQLEPHG